MIRTPRPLLLLVCGGLLLAACKKDADPQAIPIPSGSAAMAAPTTSSMADAVPTTTASAAPTTAPPPPVATAQASIDSCCAALSHAGKTKAEKDKAATAAKVCTGVAALVKSGKSQRASALTTIRAQLGGIEVPAECH